MTGHTEGVPTGPTVYHRLMDAATREPLHELRRSLKDLFVCAERDLVERLAEHLRRAYLEGVRDGFHEGLAARDHDSGGAE